MTDYDDTSWIKKWVTVGVAMFLLGALMALTGCVTPERCARMYPPSVSTDSVVVVKDSIIKKDSIIYLKGESVVIRDNAWCDSLNRAQMKPVTVRKKHLSATISIKDNKVEVDCQEDSLVGVIATLENHIRTITTNVNKETVVEVCHEEIVKWYHRWSLWIAVAALIYLAFRIGTYYYKIKNKLLP